MSLQRLGQSYLVDWFRSEFPGWSVEFDDSSELCQVRVFRGCGRDIEYGSATISRVALEAARREGADNVVLALARVAQDAHREALHKSWAKGLINNVVIGRAGKWRKWEAA